MTKDLLIAAIGVAFVVFVISRQIRRRQITWKGLTILPVWFVALALIVDHTFLQRLNTTTAIAFFAAGTLFAAAMGFVRNATMRVWMTPEGPFCEGNWRTGATWIATFAVRGAMFVAAAKLGATEGAGEAMLFVAVTLGVQNLLLAKRAGLIGTPAPAAIAKVAEPVG